MVPRGASNVNLSNDLVLQGAGFVPDSVEFARPMTSEPSAGQDRTNPAEPSRTSRTEQNPIFWSVPRETSQRIFCRSVRRLCRLSISGKVPVHRSGGTTSGESGPLAPRNRNNKPPGRTNAWRVSSVRTSTRTARSESTSNASWSSGLASNSSYRDVSTVAWSRRNALTASRRKADFLAFASTIVKAAACAHSFNGIAGDPPPLPISIRLEVDGGRYLAARAGSSSSRSIASSGLSRAVRLILRFQRERSS